MEIHLLLKSILRKEKALRHSALTLEDQGVFCYPTLIVRASLGPGQATSGPQRHNLPEGTVI